MARDRSAELRAAIDAVAAGGPARGLVVLGAPGSGKSALLRSLEADGRLVVRVERAGDDLAATAAAEAVRYLGRGSGLERPRIAALVDPLVAAAAPFVLGPEIEWARAFLEPQELDETPALAARLLVQRFAPALAAQLAADPVLLAALLADRAGGAPGAPELAPIAARTPVALFRGLGLLAARARTALVVAIDAPDAAPAAVARLLAALRETPGTFAVAALDDRAWRDGRAAIPAEHRALAEEGCILLDPPAKPVRPVLPPPAPAAPPPAPAAPPPAPAAPPPAPAAPGSSAPALPVAPIAPIAPGTYPLAVVPPNAPPGWIVPIYPYAAMPVSGGPVPFVLPPGMPPLPGFAPPPPPTPEPVAPEAKKAEPQHTDETTRRAMMVSARLRASRRSGSDVGQVALAASDAANQALAPAAPAPAAPAPAAPAPAAPAGTTPVANPTASAPVAAPTAGTPTPTPTAAPDGSSGTSTTRRRRRPRSTPSERALETLPPRKSPRPAWIVQTTIGVLVAAFTASLVVLAKRDPQPARGSNPLPSWAQRRAPAPPQTPKAAGTAKPTNATPPVARTNPAAPPRAQAPAPVALAQPGPPMTALATPANEPPLTASVIERLREVDRAFGSSTPDQIIALVERYLERPPVRPEEMPAFRAALLVRLGPYRSHPRAETRLLQSAQTGSSVKERVTAIEALCYRGTIPATARQQVALLMSDPDGAVQQKARWALGLPDGK